MIFEERMKRQAERDKKLNERAWHTITTKLKCKNMKELHEYMRAWGEKNYEKHRQKFIKDLYTEDHNYTKHALKEFKMNQDFNITEKRWTRFEIQKQMWADMHTHKLEKRIYDYKKKWGYDVNQKYFHFLDAPEVIHPSDKKDNEYINAF